ncbi:diacylglycerol/lipid kinase family protein [Longibacter salinarum]|uniref:diacylglycerol/lipid kinase family protein n=1 Tax=Longibacter salinarum TaxID=1850348 RepID=UPI0015CF236B|nr:diacylglycerol kinase family protein [Longibacter salinarum]
MLTPTHVIANPVAGSRNERRRFQHIVRQLGRGPALISWTRGPGDATALTRYALRNGARLIVVVGGDGTLNEVVNGFFDEEGRIAPDATLLPLGGGTGSDFVRTLRKCGDEKDVGTGMERCAIDVMRVSYTTMDGRREARYAVNIASAGLGGIVVRNLQASRSNLVHGPLSYFATIIRCLQTYDHDDVRIVADGRDLGVHRIRNIAVANARYFAGGLQIAPSAALDDGCLDVVILDDVPFRRLLRDVRNIYAGHHSDLPYIHSTRVRSVTLLPQQSSPVFLELDGESVGCLPATIDIVPSALNVHLPPRNT